MSSIIRLALMLAWLCGCCAPIYAAAATAPKTLDFLGEALEKVEKIKDFRVQQHVLTQLAIAQARIGNLASAQKNSELLEPWGRMQLEPILVNRMVMAGQIKEAQTLATQAGNLYARTVFVWACVRKAESGPVQSMIESADDPKERVEESVFVVIAEAEHGDFKQAETHLQDVADNDPLYEIVGYMNLAFLEYKAGKADKCEQSIQAALRIADKMGSAAPTPPWSVLARGYFRLGQIDRAVECLKKSDPKIDQHAIASSSFYALLNRHDLAGAAKLLANLDDDSRRWATADLADQCAHRGDLQNAKSYLNEAEKLWAKAKPGSGDESLYSIGETRALLEGLPAAIEWARGLTEPADSAAALIGVVHAMPEYSVEPKPD